jgi:hypothetical protein
LSPHEHDEILAVISHLSHLLAYSLMHVAMESKRQGLTLAGEGRTPPGRCELRDDVDGYLPDNRRPSGTA